MDKLDIKILKEDIKDIKKLDMKALFLIISKSISAYIHSALTFGFHNPITLDIGASFREFFATVKESHQLYDFLLKNCSSMDFEEVYEFLSNLVSIGNDTSNYYTDVLLDIKHAALTGDEWRAKRTPRKFKLVTESDDYKVAASGLLLTIEDICSYLNYPASFWEYVRPKITVVDSHNERHKGFYVVNIKCDKNNCLIDIHVMIPAIVNLHTAKVNVHELHHAYDLYTKLGKQLDENETIYEESARSDEVRFVKEYVSQIYDKRK